MKKGIIFCLVICLVMSTLSACGGGYGPQDSLLGHRFGNPELTFTDGKVIAKYPCVDCDYYEIEEIAASTQVADAGAWDAAFQNLNMGIFSADFCAVYTDRVETLSCIVTEDRAYFKGCTATDEDISAFEESYTIRKNEDTYIDYRRFEQDGKIAVTQDSDDALMQSIKQDMQVYLFLEGFFDQFTYDGEEGVYLSKNSISAQLLDANGVSLGTKTFQSVAVNIADGQVISIRANYEETNEYLETVGIDLHFYNIGYCVVKVPQSVIEEAAKSTEPNTPMESLQCALIDGEIIITGAVTTGVTDITIPAMWEGYPVVAIDHEAFAYCESLTRIVIPKSIVSIGANAFKNCVNLEDVMYQGTEEEWHKIDISQTGNDPILNATIQFRVACEHSYDDGVVTNAPTCGAMGIKTYTCVACGDTKIEYLAKHNNHSFNEGVVTDEPTCAEAGILTYTCSTCGKNKVEYIPKFTNHSYTNGICTLCGTDDPHYIAQEEEQEIGGIFGAIIRLFEAIFDIVLFFR